MKGNATLQRKLSLHPTPVRRAALDPLGLFLEMSNKQLLAGSHRYKPAYTRMLFEQIKEFAHQCRKGKSFCLQVAAR